MERLLNPIRLDELLAACFVEYVLTQEMHSEDVLMTQFYRHRCKAGLNARNLHINILCKLWPVMNLEVCEKYIYFDIPTMHDYMVGCILSFAFSIVSIVTTDLRPVFGS